MSTPGKNSQYGPGKTVRVAVVDDHPMLCAGVASILANAEGFSLVGTGFSCACATRLVLEHDPHLIFADVGMEGDIFETTRCIVAERPDIRVIILTAYDDDYYLRKAEISGAAGFVVKGIESDELISIARSAFRGEFIVARNEPIPQIQIPPSGLAATGDGLTLRQNEIIEFVGRGLSNAEIATVMGLAEGTVKNLLTDIMGQQGLRNRIEVALFAESRRKRTH